MEAGGAQGAAVRMSKEMRASGLHAETWFIYKKTDTYVNEDHIKIIYEKEPTSIKDVWIVVKKLTLLLKEIQPEGIITYTHYASILGCIAAKSAGIKNRVATIRNPVWTYPKAAKIIDKIIGAAGYYSTIIAVSAAIKQSCDNYPAGYKRRIEVVYNGVPARVSKLDKTEARRKYNIPVNKKVLLNVGRLHPQKNQKLLIDIMPSLPEYNLVLAGDGELKQSLLDHSIKLGVENHVFFTGEIKPDEVPDVLKTGDCFVFPSLFEAFGFAIFEAAYNDLPIIASNIPSTVEVLTLKAGEKAGIIVEDMSEKAWTEAVRQMENDTIRSKVLLNMQQKLPQFSFCKMVNSYIHYATKK